MKLIGRALFLFALSCSSSRAAPARPQGTNVVAAIEAGDRERRRGRYEVAVEAYDAALKQEPGQLRAHLGIQELLRRQGRVLDARTAYRSLGSPFLLARLEGSAARARREYENAPEPLVSLGRGRMAWREGDWGEARRQFVRAAQIDPGSVWGWSSLGRALFVEGRVGESYEMFRHAIWIAPQDPAGWYGLAQAAQRLGRHGAALVAARAAFERVPRDDAAADRLVGAARRTGGKSTRRAAADLLATSGTVRASLRAAELYRALGQTDKRDACLSVALQAGALQGELESITSPAVPQSVQRFLDRFVSGATARYRHYRATGETDTLVEFRDWARALYEGATGERLAAPGPVDEFAFVGALIDPTRATAEPLVRELAGHGMLLILGQRSGGPPEAMLAHIIRRAEREEVASRGTTVSREAIWIGKRYLSGYVEWLGGGDLAGLALGNIVVVDVHAAAGWEGELRRRRAELSGDRERVLAQRALADSPVDSVEDPAGVAERLLLDGEIDVAAEVLVHEDAHLVDADRYLPGRGSLARGLGLALRSGLSTSGVLAALERNAQLTAIAEGAHPRAALAVCCAALGGRGVHATGYTQIVRGMVRLVLADAAKYPTIDRERVVVQQLHRLRDWEIRSLARLLQEAWGVR
ncbi:MAG: tetratricopeptide repeat protein [Planctomycetota bacterium]